MTVLNRAEKKKDDKPRKWVVRGRRDKIFSDLDGLVKISFAVFILLLILSDLMYPRFKKDKALLYTR